MEANLRERLIFYLWWEEIFTWNIWLNSQCVKEEQPTKQHLVQWLSMKSAPHHTHWHDACSDIGKRSIYERRRMCFHVYVTCLYVIYLNLIIMGRNEQWEGKCMWVVFCLSLTWADMWNMCNKHLRLCSVLSSVAVSIIILVYVLYRGRRKQAGERWEKAIDGKRGCLCCYIS